MSDSFSSSPFEETYSGSGYLEQGCRKMQVMVQKQQVSGVSKQKDSLSFMLLKLLSPPACVGGNAISQYATH